MFDPVSPAFFFSFSNVFCVHTASMYEARSAAYVLSK